MGQKRLFLVCISALLAFSPAWAQQGNDLVFRGGSGAFTTVQQGVWSQWSVRITNEGDQPRVARVGCLADQAGGGNIVFSRVVSLPPYCARVSNLAFRPGTPNIQPNRGRGSEQTYVLWDEQTHRQVQTTTGILTYVPDATSLFGVLQADRIEHDEISYVKEESLQRVLGTLQTTATSRGNLPDVWYGFSPLTFFAVGGVDSSTFRTTQIEATLQWVRGGGCLILLGAPKLPDLLAGPMGQAAGVRAVGVHSVDSLNVSNRSNFSKKTQKQISVTLPWPLPMTELYPVEAQVLYEADGLPLLTLRRLGEGCIFTSAVPGGALKPRGEFNVWSDVGRARSVKPVIDEKAFLAPGLETLHAIAGRRGPDRLVPTTILAILLGIVILLGAGLRFVRRGEWLWILLVPLGLAVGVGLFFYSRQLGDPQRLSHVGLIQGLGGGQARLQQAFAYYSGPEAQTLDPTSGSPTGLITDQGRSTTAAMKITEIRTTADGTELPDQRIEPNDTRALYTRTVESLGALEGSLTFDETGLVGELTNHLPADVQDAVLMVNFHTYRVGSIPAGQAGNIRINDNDLLGRVQFPLPKRSKVISTAILKRAKRKNDKTAEKDTASASQTPPSAEGEFSSAIVPDKRQITLVRRLITQPSSSQTDFTGGARLIGYTASAGVDPLSGRTSQRQGWSILDWPITVAFPPAGQKVLIPAGWMDMNYRAMNWDSRHLRFIEVSRDAKVSFTAAPPAGVRLKDVTAEIAIDIHAIDYRIHVLGSLPGKAGKTVTLGTFDRPNGRVRLSVPDADRFLDARGRLALQLDVARATLNLPDVTAGTKQTKPTTPGVAGAPWQLQRVDVSLKGTVR